MAHLGGELVRPDFSLEGAGIGSRLIRPGQLYVSIVVERHGHAFIPAALGAGARGNDRTFARESEGSSASRPLCYRGELGGRGGNRADGTVRQGTGADC
jgi:hypothetical protein